MYPSDMTDAQRQVLAEHFAEMNKRGRPRVRSARDMINAIFHVQATCCQWHALPKDYPPCKQVCNTFARWRQRGLSRSLRQDCLHSAHGQAAGMTFGAGSKNYSFSSVCSYHIYNFLYH